MVRTTGIAAVSANHVQIALPDNRTCISLVGIDSDFSLVLIAIGIQHTRRAWQGSIIQLSNRDQIQQLQTVGDFKLDGRTRKKEEICNKHGWMGM